MNKTSFVVFWTGAPLTKTNGSNSFYNKLKFGYAFRGKLSNTILHNNSKPISMKYLAFLLPFQVLHFQSCTRVTKAI